MGFEFRGISLRDPRSILVALPHDTEFLDEMKQAMQIAMFMRRNTGKAATEEIELIKAIKGKEERQRVDRCKDLIVEALKKAAIYLNGNRLDIREKPPKQRIEDAFHTLIESIYHKLNYITKQYLTVDSLRELLTAKDTQVTLDGAAAPPENHLAIEDMIDVIEKSHYRNLSTTIRSLSEQFGKMPYGWRDLDFAGILLTLFKNQKVRLELNGENILATDLEVINYVTKREHQDRLVVKWRDIIHPNLIVNAKNISREVFGQSNVPNDEDGLMARIREFATSELHQKDDSIRELLREYSNARYPGKNVLEDGKKLFEQIERTNDIKGFYEYLQAEKDNLLDYSEDVQDVKKFFKNQRGIFDKALKELDIYEGNRSFVLAPETKQIIEGIEKITKLQSPYSEIHKLPELIEQFQRQFADILEQERKPILAIIEADRDATLADLNRRAFKDKFEGQVQGEFGAMLERLSDTDNILVAVGMPTESDRMKQRFIQSFIDEEARIAAELVKQNGGDEIPAAPVRKTKTMTVKTLFAGTTQITSEDDIERLLADIRARLKSQLDDDTTIQII